MQKPFWKINNNKKLIDDFKNLLIASKKLKIKFIIFPLVDNSSLRNKQEEFFFLNILKSLKNDIKKSNVKILFESDYNPVKLRNFIAKLDKKLFGINYDTGNSAALNYNMDKEFRFYGDRIYNIHIKDRLKYGKTVRLGQGNVKFKKLFRNLKKINYNGNMILQTARAKRNKDIEEILINLKYLGSLKKIDD